MSEHENVTVVFPVGYRAGQRIITRHGEIVVGPARKTELSRKLYEYMVETHAPGFFEHDQQEPTEAEKFALAGGRGPRAKLPRPGTKAWELYAAEHEHEQRQVAEAINTAHNRKQARRRTGSDETED